MSFTFKCAKCEKDFVRKKDGYQYCSQLCANQARWRVDRTKIRELAPYGFKLRMIARMVGADPHTVRDYMRSEGVYYVWASRRYQKCQA